jgi:hypothetical protein
VRNLTLKNVVSKYKMSVLRTGVYANNDTPIWQRDIVDVPGDAFVYATANNYTLSKTLGIAAQTRIKFFKVNVPSIYYGKACRFTASLNCGQISQSTGSFANITAELFVRSINNAGGEYPEQCYSSGTSALVSGGFMGMTLSVVLTPVDDAFNGIYLSNTSNDAITSVTCSLNNFSIEVIENSLVEDNGIIVAVT